ncbi:sugar transferase [Roseobacter sinensis]|uniref:Sugar transferase n=1 Tax=Roseobacter sinensis TaxID=2931391 RepID=A0ABT3BKB9_9RHOB|nr:sugar transferase [Roseobacter sp. WL0113]MCV3273804.1 sugar transferase [Roseobacter sp. WL0113]
MPFDTHDARLKIEMGPSATTYAPSSTPADPLFCYKNTVKRLFDVTLVLMSAIIVAPVILVMAFLVALDGHAPFYTQLRVGRNGKTFRIVKMRTMVHNADEVFEEHLRKNPELRAEWDATQKLKNDIRITRIGRFLRKTSLDELPQLINVLTGSMSLVGPRPMMVSQQELYPGQSYYRMRPGVTGFWQISDRNDCKFSDRAKYDANYERAMSLKTDVAVLWRTVFVVLRGTGY